MLATISVTMDKEAMLGDFQLRYKKLDNGCWEWTGPVDVDGYGDYHRGRKTEGYSRKAHRTSYILYKGILEPGMSVCHQCDTRRCVNPDHLFAASPDVNNKDCVAKGRNARGEKQGNAVLTETIVRSILVDHANGMRPYLIAEKYEVTRNQVSKITKGLRWKHITQSTEMRSLLSPLGHAKGENNGGAKLTNTQVQIIRNRYGKKMQSMTELAMEFNVSKTTICNIVNRKTRIVELD